MVVVLDDLDAIDGASRNGFVDVVAEPPLAGVLLIGAHGPAFDPGWEGSRVVTLDGLEPRAAAALTDGKLSAAMLEDVAPPSEQGGAGVPPMYVEQLVRFLHEGGGEPPDRLGDLIALRVERLPHDARRVLQAIAVVGDNASVVQLVALLPELSDLDRDLARLRRAGFITRSNGALATAHPLFREITLAGMPAEVRRLLHGRARRCYGVDELRIPLEAHARHALYAEETFEALMLLEQVATQAVKRVDYDGAIGALRLALELARRQMSRGDLDDPMSAVLIFSGKLGDTLALAGKHIDARGVLTEALDLAEPTAAERPRLLASLANVVRVTGDADLADELLDEALSLAAKEQREELVDSLFDMGRAWNEQGEEPE